MESLQDYGHYCYDEFYAEQIRVLRGCAVNHGVPVSMTRAGFEAACKANRKTNKGAFAGVKGKDACCGCKIPEKIKKGKHYSLPKGINVWDKKAYKILVCSTMFKIHRKNQLKRQGDN